MLFKEIIGQEDIKKRLVQSVKENRLSHAQLFAGPEGSGSLSLAIAYLQYINCEARTVDDSCGACSSCVKFTKVAHPDLHFVFPVNSTKEKTGTKLKSDDFIFQWREVLQKDAYFSLTDWYEAIGLENKQGIINAEDGDEIIKKLGLKAYEGEYKAMLIWLPEKMHVSAANKLLKILEEPPDKTIFILVSEQYEQLLPTITSRTQLIKVKKIKDQAMVDHLSSKYKLDQESALQLAFLADGNYTLAKKMAESGETDDFFTSSFITWMRLCYGTKVVEVMDWVETIAKSGREHQKNFFNYSLGMVRECLLLNYAPGRKLNRANSIEAGFLQKFSPFIHGGNCIEITGELNKASQHIERNANPKILFLDLSFRMMKLLRVKA